MNYINFDSSLLLFDPISIFFVAVILLISIPSAVYSIGYLNGEYSKNKIFYGWILLFLFIFSMMAVVTVNNAFLFLVVWEIMSLVSFFLVIFDSEHWESVKAGIIYIVMTHIGTVFITAAFLIMYKYANSFDYTALKQACQMMPLQTKNIVFLCLIVGFGTKAGIVPLHIWLPYAHPQAPSHISSIMSGVMIKTAIYGLIRFVITVLGVSAFWWGNLILILASVSCLVGVMYALVEHDIKKLLAYHSVENIGIILLGVGASMVFAMSNMPVLSVLAMTAGLYHLVNHAIFKSLLFLTAGNVYKATGLRDMEKFGGLIKTMPWTANLFLIGAMGISALPPLNGFVSEWLTLQALFCGVANGIGYIKLNMGIYAAVLALTSGLAAACFVKAFGITFLAMPRSENAKNSKEVTSVMLYTAGFLAVLTVLFGLLAAPIIKILSRTAEFVYGISGSGINFTFNNFVVTPLSNSKVTISTPFIAIVLVLIAGIVGGLMRYFLKKRKISINKTWDCGYYELDSRTEYTATAFSQPFRMALSFFYLPHTTKERIKESYYHIKSIKYETAITPVFKKYIYENILKKIFGAADIFSKLQSGSIHFYLAYIFIVIVFLIMFIDKF